jgi:hypothetical protein
MKPSRPPALATRLLERSGANPALIGDLIEEYGLGRSRTWYWKQVFNVLVRECLSSKIAAMVALRWFAALPFAMLAADAAQRLVGFFARRSISVTSMRPFAGAQPRLIYNFDHFMIWMYVGLFLMPAAFVSAGLWAAPGRRDSVARIALSVVAVWSVLIATGVSHFSGQPFSAWQLAAGVCVLLGGVTGSLPWLSYEKRKRV